MKRIEADEVKVHYLDFALLSHLISWSFSVMMCNRSIPWSWYLCWATRGWKGRCILKVLPVSDLTSFLTANLSVSFLPSLGCPCPGVSPPDPQSLTTFSPPHHGSPWYAFSVLADGFFWVRTFGKGCCVCFEVVIWVFWDVQPGFCRTWPLEPSGAGCDRPMAPHVCTAASLWPLLCLLTHGWDTDKPTQECRASQTPIPAGSGVRRRTAKSRPA